MPTTTYTAPDTAAAGSGDDMPSGNGSFSGMAGRAADTIRQQADAVTEQLRPRIDAMADYAREEPAKALLIAAATGAGLMALLALATRGDSVQRSIDKSASGIDKSIKSVDKSDLLDTLRDLLSRLPSTASSAASSAVNAAGAAADVGKDRASTLASTVADTVTDTLKNWRQQASPVVERIRPQFDAVTAYAKEEPVKAALGVAVTGAIIAGLVAALRSDD